VSSLQLFFSSKTLLIGWKICWNRSPFDNQRTKGRGGDKKEISISTTMERRTAEPKQSVREGVRRGRRNVLRWQQRGLSH
jgi:hypothetical protein